jgi:hypothetical protein
MLASSMIPTSTQATDSASYLKPAYATSTVSVLATSTQTIATSTNPNAGVQAKVESYFSDIPIMVDVSKCESRYRQYEKDGSVFRGIVNNADVGVMQINEYYHLDTAEKLGDDIYTVSGNLAYARYLYDKEGTAPWVSSSACWKKAAANDPAIAASKATTTVASL